MELKQNHVYLAKGLPVRRSAGLWITEKIIDENKEIQRVTVVEVTNSCYLLSLYDNDKGFYVEKTDPDITYLEDLGVKVKQ